MPRTLAPAFRQAIEASASSELLLCFATITHPQLSVPIYAACDVVDYIYPSGGNRYFGIPFDFQLLTDSDKPPTCTIRMQNVDLIIGTAVTQLQTVWPRLRLQVFAGSDFGPVSVVGGRNTRVPLGTPTVEYDANHLRIVNVTCDAVAVQGQITSIDLTREPWPATRATKERLPGLFV
jgi:hypothetical protein